MDNKERFSNRVEMYAKYRPSYPEAAMSYLYDTVGLSDDCTVADIGAGTGIFSKLLIARGSRVIAVEPNEPMRRAAESDLAGERNFRAVAGAAESTGLPDQSVDFIVCAQSFHWFNHAEARIEFRRILKPGGKAVLIWNSRLLKGTPFLEQYEQLLRTFGTDYAKTNHKNISREALTAFFHNGDMQEARFMNRYAHDFEQLSGRMQSSSYIPVSGDPAYEPMMVELRNVFERTNQDGVVFFDYETEVYWGEV